MIAALFAAGALLVSLACYYLGHLSGRKRGRDEGWSARELDRIEENARRERARRNQNGQFKEKGTK